MTPEQRAAQARLQRLVERHEATRGLYVRVRGKNLIVGREERFDPAQEPVKDDRLRFTHLGVGTYGLAHMRHTGRWENMPFTGSLDELVEMVANSLPHLVAPVT